MRGQRGEVLGLCVDLAGKPVYENETGTRLTSFDYSTTNRDCLYVYMSEAFWNLFPLLVPSSACQWPSNISQIRARLSL
jgi:hypothetical protein